MFCMFLSSVELNFSTRLLLPLPVMLSSFLFLHQEAAPQNPILLISMIQLAQTQTRFLAPRNSIDPRTAQ